MFTPNFVNGFLFGAMLGFFVSLISLNVYYKVCCGMWRDEIVKQYNNRLESIKNGKPSV